MDKQTLEIIEKEISTFVRRIVMSEKQNGKLERAAYVLLRQLSAQGPTGVKALSMQLHLDISTVSRQAAALEQRNYIDKIPNPKDGRSYFYRITPSGNQALDEGQQNRLDRLTVLLADWTDEEKQSFGYLLTKYNQTIHDTTDRSQ